MTMIASHTNESVLLIPFLRIYELGWINRDKLNDPIAVAVNWRIHVAIDADLTIEASSLVVFIEDWPPRLVPSIAAHMNGRRDVSQLFKIVQLKDRPTMRTFNSAYENDQIRFDVLGLVDDNMMLRMRKMVILDR